MEISYMNPNSANQLWSKWTFTVRHKGLGVSKLVTRAEVESNFAKFARKIFGSAGVIDIKVKRGRLIVEILVESLSVTPHDPRYRDFVNTQASAFFVAGFGPETRVRTESKIMAGSKQDGTPAEQMLILPHTKIFFA